MQQLEDIIRYYREQGAPQDQQMLIALLREAQQELGGVLWQDALDEIAKACGVKPGMLTALIRRVPTLRMADAPHRLEMCQTCPKGRELRAWVEETFHIQSGGVCAAGGFTYRVTPCMKNCKNGPSVKWDGELVPQMTLEKLKKMLGK